MAVEPETSAILSKSRAVDTRTPRTRQKIIEATEMLIAEHGIHAVSARMISRACKMRNNVAVQYHFGTMEELYKAIMEWRMARLNTIRRELMMQQPWPTGERKIVARAVELICLPHLELRGADGKYPYAAFLCEYLPVFQPEGIPWVMNTDPDSPANLVAMAEILERIRSILPNLAGDLVNRRIANTGLLFFNVLRNLRFASDSDQHRQILIADTLIQASGIILAELTLP